MSWTIAVEVEEVTLVNFTFRAGFGLMLWVGELWNLRAEVGCVEIAGGFLHLVPLMVVTGSLKVTFRVVFLKLPWPWAWGKEALHG